MEDRSESTRLNSSHTTISYAVFHAGTTLDESGQLKTSGGRVLCATALADSLKQAQARAYDLARAIHFDGAQYRRDIGYRALKSGS